MRSILCCIILFFTVGPLFAQTSTLRGVVTDESGAVVPSAKVAATGADGTSRTVATNASGAYVFLGLPNGDYAIQASAPSLAQPQPMKITLGGNLQTLNLQLTVAATKQQVTVQDNGGPSVSLDSASNSTALVLRGADLDSLADDPEDLAADLQALAGPSAGPSGGSIYIDGFSGGELPPKSSIREIRINQNPFSPEYDKLGYGRIEIFTKPGADKLRGAWNYNYANDALNSRNPYSVQKAPLLLQELEGDSSGPLGKRASWTFEAQQNNVDNGAIIHAVTLDPGTFAATPFNDIFKTLQGRTRVSPRLDYQVNENNTVTFRYNVTHGEITGGGIGSFDLLSRGTHLLYTNQTVQAIETAVLGSSINETRFQYYRNASQTTALTLAPALQVLGAFTGGGSAVGQSSDTQNNFELQNNTSMVHGPHALRFGVRLREMADGNVSPQNFNGTFTFTSLDQYRQTLGASAARALPGADPGGGRRRRAVQHQRRHPRACGSSVRRRHLCRRRLACAAQSDAEPGASLRNANQPFRR